MLHLLYSLPSFEDSAQNRNRTSDTRIFSPLLYRLSYLGRLRGQDLNLRPSGYEPDELPDCSIPRYPIFVLDFSSKADDRTRTDNLLITNQLLCQLSHIGRLPDWQVGGGGFEPPKQFAADLQSVPFGHSGIHPKYRIFNCTILY